ncbi:MAG: dimethyl sulfoxide reductase anchor subunit family protein [Paracoccaceae bacterium]
MNPAPSVIAFSTLSGAGFGMLVWLGLGLLTPTGWAAFAFFAIAYVLAVGGLISATFHLGRPERAHLAFSQWRTSWLSREGVAAVAALVVMALYGAGLVFWATPLRPLGWLGAALSLFTVLTTAMIYAQLRTVPRWHHWSVPAFFLTTSLAGGALLTGRVTLAAILLVVAGAAVAAHWAFGDRRLAAGPTGIGTATGLGARGAVRQLEGPHTAPNYLTTEMVYRVARRQVLPLRAIALTLGYALPAIVILLAPNHAAGALAVAAHLTGVACQRWLFFAQAEHVMGFYYDAHRAA